MPYDGLPTLDLRIFAPGKMFVIGSGASLEGGRNGHDEPQSISLGAGGRLKIAYTIDIFTPEQHGYLNRIEARMTAGFRYLLVPIMWEWYGPFPAGSSGYPVGETSYMFDPDESLIDGATGLTPTVTAIVYENAPLHSGKIKLHLLGAVGTINHSLWFSIDHGDVKGHRAYRTWEHTELAPDIYEVSLDRPTRAAITAGMPVRIHRPQCVMRYETGAEAGWEVMPFWRSQATLSFVEAP